MTMLDLPRDLLEDIVSRIPDDDEPLRELRCTCKQWNALFKDRGFLKKRFEKAAREVIVLKNSKLYLLNVDIQGRRSYTTIKFGMLHSDFEIYISDIFHCDGLLLLRTTSRKNKLIVWNPCLGHTMNLYPRNRYKGGIFALGYHNELCDSYKVLSIYPKRESSELHIFDFYTDTWSWRVLDDVTLGCDIQSRGVSLKGNTYWIASQVIKDFLLLLSFDFTTERFGRLNLPSQHLGYEILALSVVKEEQLSVLQQSLRTSKVEIWVTTNDKIDQTKVLSWSKLLAVDLKTYYDHRFTCDVSFVIDEVNKVAVCWDKEKVYIFGEDHHYGNYDFGGYGCENLDYYEGYGRENLDYGGYGCEPHFPAAMFQGCFKFNLQGVNVRKHVKFDEDVGEGLMIRK